MEKMLIVYTGTIAVAGLFAWAVDLAKRASKRKCSIPHCTR